MANSICLEERTYSKVQIMNVTAFLVPYFEALDNELFYPLSIHTFSLSSQDALIRCDLYSNRHFDHTLIKPSMFLLELGLKNTGCIQME